VSFATAHAVCAGSLRAAPRNSSDEPPPRCARHAVWLRVVGRGQWVTHAEVEWIPSRGIQHAHTSFLGRTPPSPSSTYLARWLGLVVVRVVEEVDDLDYLALRRAAAWAALTVCAALGHR
jgi:hypothetical protein